MKKFLSVSIVLVAILLSIIACKKKEEHPVPRMKMKEGPLMEKPLVLPDHGGESKKSPLQVVVPEMVKGKWSAVKLMVEDKKLNKTEEFTVNLGSELRVPDSGLLIKTGDFLPDFKMSGNMITSASNAPNNPAVGVIIYEDGKQIFPERGQWGWLYAKYPTIHPFKHERFGVILKTGIKSEATPTEKKLRP